MVETSDEQATLTPVVLGFGDQGVNRALLYTDFEALWRGETRLADCAGRRHRFVYLQLDAERRVRAAVFFLLAFDSAGMPLPEWNLPLAELATRAGAGPDLGAGAIRLASRAQCPISWHQADLWDPRSDGEHDDWQAIRDCLGWVAPQAGEVELANEYVQPAEPLDGDARLERVRRMLVREHQEALDKLIAGQRARLQALSRQHQEQLAQLQAEIDSLRQAAAEHQERYTTLEQRLERQTEGARQQRDELTEQLRILEKNGAYKVEALRIQAEAEREARVVAATDDLRNQLSIRDVELRYRDELDAQAQDELRALRERCERLAQDSGEGLLERLARQGVLFVTFQPGLGHLILNRHEVPQFSADPPGFVAERCQVERPHYMAWLAHHQQPSCTAEVAGVLCGQPLARIERPADFRPGRSDRCAEHRESQEAEAGAP